MKDGKAACQELRAAELASGGARRRIPVIAVYVSSQTEQ